MDVVLCAIGNCHLAATLFSPLLIADNAYSHEIGSPRKNVHDYHEFIFYGTATEPMDVPGTIRCTSGGSVVIMPRSLACCYRLVMVVGADTFMGRRGRRGFAIASLLLVVVCI